MPAVRSLTVFGAFCAAKTRRQHYPAGILCHMLQQHNVLRSPHFPKQLYSHNLHTPCAAGITLGILASTPSTAPAVAVPLHLLVAPLLLLLLLAHAHLVPQASAKCALHNSSMRSASLPHPASWLPHVAAHTALNKPSLP
jgi:hypothetical protein